jgi:membrane-bound lytic murein transglycosylase F
MRVSRRLWFGILLASLVLTACGQQGGRLDEIRQRGELVVVTRNAPTTYYEGREGLAGFEYEMVTAFAQSLGVKPRFVIKDSLGEMLDLLAQGQADLAAAGLTHTDGRDDTFLFSIPYQFVTQQVVCRRGGKRPRNIEDLVEVSLTVPARSSYAEYLQQLTASYPQLQWQEDPQADTEELLERVWLKQLDCTVADSNIVAINRRYYPELTVRFDLSPPQPLAWAMPASADDLADAVNQWLDRFKAGEAFSALLDKYYGFIEVFDYVDIRAFKRRIKSRLPRYRKWFEAAAAKYNFDWTLLAAQSYQESHWNPRARSPTGVRGIMMLTRTTAREVGVRNRLNPKQNILGGARYLAGLRKRIPDPVPEPDRDWMTLAAYNVGMGHLYDARELARRLDRNPDRWPDLGEVFPLLSRKQYYKTLKHGYARGREPVIYVQRIRNYQDILIRELGKGRVTRNE